MWPASAREASSTLDAGENPQGRSVERLWATFMAARVAVSAVMVLLQIGVWMLSGHTSAWGVLLCLLHLGATVAGLKLLRPSGLPTAWQWPWRPTVALDGAVYAVLHTLGPGGLNYSLLFALPVLMAASLGPLRRALAAAASVTLFLLIDAGWRSWQLADDGASRYLQAALTGSGHFLIAVLAHQLSVRLAREEARAVAHQRAARTQAEVNALVIETLSDGVLVVDGDLRIQAANPAARALLGDGAGLAWAGDTLAVPDQLAPLRDLVTRTLALGEAQTAEIQLETANGQPQRLRVQTRPMATGTDPAGREDPWCVVFLQDLHEIEARIRAEKLASMGRMTVAVAHEIRNPLSAIVQASQMLAEEVHDPLPQQLVGMIDQNTQRLSRIVDDILNVVRVPGRPALEPTEPLALDAALAPILSEWCGQHACTGRLVWHTRCGGTRVRFDPEHLRRVLVNLLDNAARYASTAAGAIQVDTAIEPGGMVRLSVWSDGAPLEPGIRRHLFEPFFSSQSRSSGMGLYLCRELCDRYHARLDYRRSERGGCSGNEFFVLMTALAAPQP